MGEGRGNVLRGEKVTPGVAASLLFDVDLERQCDSFCHVFCIGVKFGLSH
jgi:hypothetical protein